jgi:hypothetical protein
MDLTLSRWGRSDDHLHAVTEHGESSENPGWSDIEYPNTTVEVILQSFFNCQTIDF